MQVSLSLVNCDLNCPGEIAILRIACLRAIDANIIELNIPEIVSTIETPVVESLTLQDVVQVSSALIHYEMLSTTGLLPTTYAHQENQQKQQD